MNLAEFCSAVRLRAGVPSSDAFNTDDQIKDLVNEALMVLSADVDDASWLLASDTFTTTAGTQSYTPPADWGRTKLLTIDAYPEVEWRPLGDIRSWPEDTQGVPRYYTATGSEILLAPIPDASYTVRHDYYVEETPLTDDTDTPLLPSTFHHAVVAYATHLALLRSGESQRATMELSNYQGWLRRIQNQKRRSVKAARVRVRPGRQFL